jgi:hypothetical protein
MSWLRWWDGTCSDPKWRVIAARSAQPVGDIVAVWAWLLERARQADGDIGDVDVEEIAVTYGYEVDNVASILKALADKGLIGEGAIKNWRKRQPKREDDSRERVKAWRAAKACNESVTHCNAPEAEADTERKQEPVASATGCDDAAPKPALSLVDQLWTDGIVTLETMRVIGPKARSMVGKWLKDTGSDAGRVLWAINEAQVHGSGDPIPYISRVLSDRSTGQRAPPRQAPYQTRRSFGEIARESAAKLAGYRDEPDRQADEYSGPTLDLVAGGSGPDIVDLHSRRSGGF